MKLTGLQRAFIKTMDPIEKAIFTFSLLKKEIPEENTKQILKRIIEICECAKWFDSPMDKAKKNLLLILETEEFSIQDRNSLLSSIDLLEKIKNN